MNIQECDILNALYQAPYINQRVLAQNSGHSLGIVNRSIKQLIRDGYLNDSICLTEKAHHLFQQNAPRNAIILAAGFGMRMVPINTHCAKAFLEVGGEPLIERIIRQLREVGVFQIHVVVGFMKEAFEYLIDEYGVELIVNNSYSAKNNLHSLALASKYIRNTYIVPCDIWCAQNPFHPNELYSWYMVSDTVDEGSPFRVNRKTELLPVSKGQNGNTLIGIAYLVEDQGRIIRKRLEAMDASHRFDNAFWEEALLEKGKCLLHANVVPENYAVEINTYEQLRDLDSTSNQLQSDAISTIAKALQVLPDEIKDISVLKKGMTNRSFLFSCRGQTYIMRIPGEGTDRLINRMHESAVYQLLSGRGICDDIAYINPENGYKITAFLDSSRVCNPSDPEDVKLCMEKLRQFHSMHLTVDHEFPLFRQIDFYESLWNGSSSVYRDYINTKQNVFRLKSYIDTHVQTKCLTHIDAVPDNFLFTADGDLRLIDWEYAGMQDPHVDIAMFCIYAMYDRTQIDTLIDLYFENKCPLSVRVKIYCYIAVCGLLWSNWCEYKRNLGVEFGEYALKQYRYAKEYCKIARDYIEKMESEI